MHKAKPLNFIQLVCKVKPTFEGKIIWDTTSASGWKRSEHDLEVSELQNSKAGVWTVLLPKSAKVTVVVKWIFVMIDWNSEFWEKQGRAYDWIGITDF